MYLDQNASSAKAEIFNRAGRVLDPAAGVDNIMTVLPGSPSEAAGLKTGDRITHIDGHAPADDPNDPVFTQPVGTVLHLTVRRGGADHVYDVTLRDML